MTSEPHSGSSAHNTPAADECRRLMDKLHAHSSANRRCADCASDQDISWCSINLAVLLCSKCSGAHRAMGCGVSKVSDRTQLCAGADRLVFLSRWAVHCTEGTFSYPRHALLDV